MNFSSINKRQSKRVATLLLLAALAMLPKQTMRASVRDEASPIVVVRVRGESIVQSEQLTLGDVAEVESSEMEAGARVRAIRLGYAPQVGAVRELSRERIQLAIAASGFQPNRVRLEVPNVTLVRRASQQVDLNRVREEIERVTLAELMANGATARLVRLELPPMIEAPTGAVEVRATTSGARNLFAPFSVGVELRVEGQVVRRFNATAQVEAFAPVLIAAHDVAANERVRSEDARVEVRRLERPASFYLRDEKSLRGVAAERVISRGEAITKDALVAPLIVHPGDTVRIIGEAAGVRVTVIGEARASGRVGDSIQVKNAQSGQTLQAIIVDENTVSVRF